MWWACTFVKMHPATGVWPREGCKVNFHIWELKLLAPHQPGETEAADMVGKGDGQPGRRWSLPSYFSFIVLPNARVGGVRDLTGPGAL